MILTAHLLFGAAIANIIKNPVLAIILAFLSHYLLDFIPHLEYSIENIKEKRWQRSLPDFFRVFLDFCFGILFILIFSKNQPIIFIAAFFAILADGFGFLNLIFPNKVLKIHDYFHQKKIHFLKHKKIPHFWRIFNQAAIIVIAALLLI